jgi:peptide deformylase
MTVRPLRLFGDPVLRTASDTVTRFDEALTALVDDLLDTVAEPGRAGLAANQIGSGLAVFAYNVDGQLGYLINPRITDRQGMQLGLEGCLSVPGIWAERQRPALVVAEGVDLERNPVVVTGSEELARCLEHETDHLAGQLYIDGLEPAERRRVMRELQRDQLASRSPGPPWD